MAVLIVGDFTARVGDPSGKSETRPRLTKEEVDGYAERLLDQFRLVLSTASALEVRRNSEWLEPMDMEGDPRAHGLRTRWRGCSSATTSRSATQAGQADLDHGVPVPAAPGVRLGGRRGRRRARGHRPDVQPARGPRAPARPRAGAAGRADDAAPRGARRRPEDEPVARQLRRDHRAARRAVRQADVDPRRLDREVPAACARRLRPTRRSTRSRPAWPTARSTRTSRSAGWRARSSTCTTGRVPGNDAEARFDQVHKQHELPDDVPETPDPGRCAPRRQGVASAGCWWRRAWRPRTGRPGARSQQGGVRLDGEPLDDPEAEFEPEALRGKVLQVGRRRFVRLV